MNFIRGRRAPRRGGYNGYHVEGVDIMNAKKRWSIVAVAGALLIAMAACDDSETVAPDGSTISLAPTPATILISNGTQAGEVTVLATVRNAIGIPLPGQDVRFTNTSGVLVPTAGTPVATDDDGNAVTVLDQAKTQTTVTAQSGKATETIQLQTASCNIQNIALDQAALNFTACSGPGSFFVLRATVTDTSNDPCVGVLVTFKSTVASLPATDVALSISPGSSTTDNSGEVSTTVSLDSNCSSRCPGQDCNTSLQSIVASGGGTTSDPVTVNISIN